MDTIYALATARGKAGIAIVRVSGPEAFYACEKLAGSLPKVRRPSLRLLKNSDAEIIDESLVLCFEAGQSFTGEDVVELQIHGSKATCDALLQALGAIPELRGAEPGEFTRQALENDRLDLTQVEGLADLIDAETDSQRRQAMKVLSGELGIKASGWRTKLVRSAALLEATIDFVDEDVPVDVLPEVSALVNAVRSELETESKGAEIAEIIRDGFEVAIVGAPNVGKSTLLNVLAGREAAITSEIAGTTRDVIEVKMDLRGLSVTFLDTAGLRDTVDIVESIGVERAIERAKSADLRVFLQDDDAVYSGLVPESDDIRAFCKVDLRSGAGFGVSGKTGQGVTELVDQIAKILEKRTAMAATATRERHRLAIDQAVFALDLATTELNQGAARTEFAAEELRKSIRSLDSLMGFVDIEHILGEIFASFCVGK